MRILEGKNKVVFDGTRGGSFQIERNASFVYVIDLNKGERNILIEINLKGEFAQARVLGVFNGSGSDKFHLNIVIHHDALDTRSETLVKGVLKNSAQCIFSGLVEIEKSASGTIASLTERTLLLSDAAKAESLPFLEIKNNDVSVNHAVTVSTLDKEQLWYLQSRGLDTHSAQQLITEGFLEEVRSRMPKKIEN